MYIYVYIERQTHYKELAQVIKEAEKSPDLQPASWSRRRGEGISCNLSLSVSLSVSLKAAEDTDVPAQRQAEREFCYSAFLFYSGL